MRLQSFLCFRMEFGVYGFQLWIDNVRIYLRRRNITVPHQFLNGTYIRTVFQQMHRKAVTQRVRGDFLFNIRSTLVMF